MTLKNLVQFPLYIALEILYLLFWHQIPLTAEIGLLLMVFFGIVWTASKHAWIYSKGAGKYEDNLHFEYKPQEFIYHKLEIHNTQMWGEYLLFSIAMLAGASPLRVLGTQFLARIPFQGLINWSTGKTFIDDSEGKKWFDTKKFLPGKWSILKIPIGIACFILAQVMPKIILMLF